jgi:hypothetical protein
MALKSDALLASGGVKPAPDKDGQSITGRFAALAGAAVEVDSHKAHIQLVHEVGALLVGAAQAATPAPGPSLLFP